MLYLETENSIHSFIDNGKKSSLPTVFLHGFAGTSDSWREIMSLVDFHCIAPDVVGHGKSTFKSLSNHYSIDDWCIDFSEFLDRSSLHKVNLCGYSMGGRLAIAFAAHSPSRINNLFLESTQLGIKSEQHRRERVKEEMDRCSEIESNLHDFIVKWEDNPLFINQRERNEIAFLHQRDARLSHNPKHLSKALKAFGLGSVGSYEKEFSAFKFSTVIVTGEEDKKYTQIGKAMNKMHGHSVHYTIPGCGHNTHLENPGHFIDCISSVSDPHDSCKICGDVKMYCSCHIDIIDERPGQE